MIDMFYFTILLIGLCASCFITGVVVTEAVYNERKRRKESKTMVSDIFATEERQRVLNDNEIKYKIDSDFNFVFDTKAIYEKALSVLVKALAI